MNEQLDEILYPPIEPYESGELIVGDGHRVYWEQSGNPEGKPVVFLHGGPGAGTSPWHRRFFDPERYRIVLFDQRGSGRSTPHASDPRADLRYNTTWHLVADMELLRRNLAIAAWQVFGGSWGSALALAYAEAHPHRVTELVLRGIFTLRRHELEWFYEGGASVIFPDLWEDFIAPIPVLERSRLIEAYHRRLFDPDPGVHIPAGVAWSRWEASTLTLLADDSLVEEMTDPAAATAFARIENHYFMHGGWFEEGQLIDGVDAVRGIPAVIVQGRYDVCTPIMTAWDLHRAWPEAEFVVVPDASHSASEPGIARALRAATDGFARDMSIDVAEPEPDEVREPEPDDSAEAEPDEVAEPEPADVATPEPVDDAQPEPAAEAVETVAAGVPQPAAHNDPDHDPWSNPWADPEHERVDGKSDR